GGSRPGWPAPRRPPPRARPPPGWLPPCRAAGFAGCGEGVNGGGGGGRGRSGGLPALGGIAHDRLPWRPASLPPAVRRPGSLGTARIPEVAAAAIATQEDLRAPGAPAVATQPGANAVGGRAIAVGQADAPVGQADQARRVALPQLGRGHGVQPPALRVVLGAV